jgi:hypothetical protein
MAALMPHSYKVRGRFILANGGPGANAGVMRELRSEVLREAREATDAREVLSVLWSAESEGIELPDSAYMSVRRFSPSGDEFDALNRAGLDVEDDGRVVECEPLRDDGGVEESQLSLREKMERADARLARFTPDAVEVALQGDPDEATDDLLRDLDYHAAGSTPTRIAPKRGME